MTTTEEVIRLAREVWPRSVLPFYELFEFAAKVASLAKAEENEACAKACEDRAGTMSMFATTRDAKTHTAAVKGDAAAIRARRNDG